MYFIACKLHLNKFNKLIFKKHFLKTVPLLPHSYARPLVYYNPLLQTHAEPFPIF